MYNYKTPKRIKNLLINTDGMLLEFKQELDRIFESDVSYPHITYISTFADFYDAMSISFSKYHQGREVLNYIYKLLGHDYRQFCYNLEDLMLNNKIVEDRGDREPDISKLENILKYEIIEKKKGYNVITKEWDFDDVSVEVLGTLYIESNKKDVVKWIRKDGVDYKDLKKFIRNGFKEDM